MIYYGHKEMENTATLERGKREHSRMNLLLYVLIFLQCQMYVCRAIVRIILRKRNFVSELLTSVSYFSAKTLPGSPFKQFYDGGVGKYNHPGPVAKAEAIELFQNKSACTLVKVGCGKQKSSDKISTDQRFYHRVYRLISDASKAAELHHYSNTEPDFTYLNPDLDMDETSLDDISTLETLQTIVTSYLATNNDYRTKYEIPSAWLLTASLFYFEFFDQPQGKDQSIRCSGIIKCRYPDDQNLCRKLREHLEHITGFSINGKYFPFKLPCKVNFSLQSLTQNFDIQLLSGEKRSSISGLPDTAENILNIQKNCLRGGFIRLRSKRRFEAIYPNIVEGNKRKKFSII